MDQALVNLTSSDAVVEKIQSDLDTKSVIKDATQPLSSQITDVFRVANSTSTTLQTLVSIVTHIKDEVHTLSETIRVVQESIEKLSHVATSEQVDTVLRQIEDLKKEITELKQVESYSVNEIQTDQSSLHDIAGNFQTLSAQIVNLDAKLTEINSGLQTADTTLQTIKSVPNAPTAVSQDSPTTSQEVMSVDSKVDEMNKMIQVLYGDVEAIKSASPQVPAPSSDVSAQVQILEAKMEQINNTLLSLSSSIETLRGGYSGSNQDSGVLSAIESLRAQFESSNRSSSQDSSYQVLQRIESLSSEITSLKYDVESLKK